MQSNLVRLEEICMHASLRVRCVFRSCARRFTQDDANEGTKGWETCRDDYDVAFDTEEHHQRLDGKQAADKRNG
jgi:hypothetical protein